MQTTSGSSLTTRISSHLIISPEQFPAMLVVPEAFLSSVSSSPKAAINQYARIAILLSSTSTAEDIKSLVPKLFNNEEDSEYRFVFITPNDIQTLVALILQANVVHIAENSMHFPAMIGWNINHAFIQEVRDVVNPDVDQPPPSKFALDFALGCARGVTLGKANRSVQIMEPKNGEIFESGSENSLGINVSTGFGIGRDGCWCLYANEILISCITRPGYEMKVRFLNWAAAAEGKGGRSFVTLRVDLRSNVFDHTIYRGEEVSVFVVDRKGGGKGEQGGGGREKVCANEEFSDCEQESSNQIDATSSTAFTIHAIPYLE
jgi:hypothetical protein